jgi:hypothetical protein
MGSLVMQILVTYLAVSAPAIIAIFHLKKGALRASDLEL